MILNDSASIFWTLRRRMRIFAADFLEFDAHPKADCR
jgi:hypothetical protein